jgi:hypothetical protein
MTPFVHLGIERQRLGPARMLGDDDLGAEGLVGNQRTEIDAVDQRRHADGVEAMAGKEDEAHEIAERVSASSMHSLKVVSDTQ